MTRWLAGLRNGLKSCVRAQSSVASSPRAASPHQGDTLRLNQFVAARRATAESWSPRHLHDMSSMAWRRDFSTFDSAGAAAFSPAAVARQEIIVHAGQWVAKWPKRCAVKGADEAKTLASTACGCACQDVCDPSEENLADYDDAWQQWHSVFGGVFRCDFSRSPVANIEALLRRETLRSQHN